MGINVGETLMGLVTTSGIYQYLTNPLALIMVAIACVLLYLAIVKQFEPLLLLPIAFGMLLTNLLGSDIFHEELFAGGHANWALFGGAVLIDGKDFVDSVGYMVNAAGQILTSNNVVLGHFVNAVTIDDPTKLVPFADILAQFAANGNAASIILEDAFLKNGAVYTATGAMLATAGKTISAGLLDYLYLGVKLGIYPCLIFMGVGAGTDFGPLISNPKTLLLGAAAQLGIFMTFIFAYAVFGFSAAEAGAIGIIIPPSIPMVIYGVSGQQSISKMFMAGIIPGILIAVGLSVMHFFLCRNLKTEGLDWSMKTFIHSLRDGFWSILAPVIILGGIYAGIFTPTEAAVVAIFYTILVGIFIHKELTLKSFMASLKTTSWLTGRVLVLVFTATAFGYLLTSYRIPVEIANWILSFTNNVNLVWFFVVILLLFLGMFMETLAIIMLVTPVLLPIMTAYGVDPIHFGIILICCCGIGFSTPPLGENMFIASGIANISLEEISLKALPLVAINIAVIAILVMFPDIVLFLPNLMGTGLQ